MTFRLLADVVVVVHATFVLFVVLGGVAVLRWPRVAWAHVPAAAWGVLVEYSGWICPLTPLEDYLRQRGGQIPYNGGFVDRYLLPVLYPDNLTRPTQIVLGTIALAINVFVYARVLTRLRRASPPGRRSQSRR